MYYQNLKRILSSYTFTEIEINLDLYFVRDCGKKLDRVE